MVLSHVDRKKILAVTILQILMGGLDLLGIVAIGLLGAVSVSGLQSIPPVDQVNAILGILYLQETSFEIQLAVLGGAATFFLVGRTILSIVFTRRLLFFLSRRGAQISASLVFRLLSQSILLVQSRSSQETVYAVTSGVERIVLQVIATSIVWIADFALLVVIVSGLIVVDPFSAMTVIAVFVTVWYFLYKFMNVRATRLGIQNTRLTINSNEKIVEVFSSYRESIVRNRRDYYAKQIGEIRFTLASTSAEIGFLPYVSKYIIESTIIIGAVFVGATQFLFQDTSHAITTFAVFLAAGTRIAPAILRLQQGMITIKGGLASSLPTLDLIDEIGIDSMTANVEKEIDLTHEGFSPEVVMKDVSFMYPGKGTPAIKETTLHIPVGAFVAVVGPSGAGKTTLIDVLLGVLQPDKGFVTISGVPPLSAITEWPGAISYVPQDIVISDGTIRENISLGFPIEVATDELVSNALKVAGLEELISELPEGLDTRVGERGAKISGGQRQRVGIARAMFTRPSLLVLDEATSALDSEAEGNVSGAIQALRGITTVLVIAHRISTVKNADQILYLSSGRLIASGTFEEVRKAVPDFDQQANLMGL
jgi:ABC-type multidrug transport system fused ATPase/permease subunit